MKHPLHSLAEAYRRGERAGIASVCSAHPVVIEAALRLGRESDGLVLIEATCNQVNQDGGYTGMTPASFRAFVEDIARKVEIPFGKVILGGDHLGPNPWKHLPPNEAMGKAESMVAAYAAAGFSKLHLDTSMGCQNEPAALDDFTTAERATQLASIAERHASGPYKPVYVIGTEVPVPGGAFESLDHLQITKPDAIRTTYQIHKAAFEKLALNDAFSRVVAMVVQPGVEFGHEAVVQFEAEKAKLLSQCLAEIPGIIFEAHSTDYQSAASLENLTSLGFSILKVGPWLTFALREALYGLDAIADVLEGQAPRQSLMICMEEVMQASPGNWKKYYSGTEKELWLMRHFSYSDRIRYYWPDPKAAKAVAALRARLVGKTIPPTLVSQFLPALREKSSNGTFDGLLIESVQSVLATYVKACRS